MSVELMKMIKGDYKDLRSIKNTILDYDVKIKELKDEQDGFKQLEKAKLESIKHQLELHPDKKVKDDISKFTISIVNKTTTKVDEKRLESHYHETYLNFCKTVTKFELGKFKKEMPDHSCIEKITTESLQVRDNMKKEK